MTRFGLDLFIENFPRELVGKRLGLLCHAPSITSSYSHAIDVLAMRDDCTLGAIFGPQHGLFGQTQANMIEWEGAVHPRLGIPLFSLYGQHRKPTPPMLAGLDALVIDLQDVGARLYTYIWTVKLCLEACAQAGLPVWILDRPNPIAALDFDGPLLSPDFFTFVGGAQIPMCHRMTMGEMALLIQKQYVPTVELHVVTMQGWWRDSQWNQTGLPWVLPSPNMPTLDSALVYPGTVLFEATNVSEARGTTRPFELFGAPWLAMEPFTRALYARPLSGCVFREHGFTPTFDKWAGQFCFGMQLHVTAPRSFEPFYVAAHIMAALLESCGDTFAFLPPPYEYEVEKMPFDILSGDDSLRLALLRGSSLEHERERWREGYASFLPLFKECSLYTEQPA